MLLAGICFIGGLVAVLSGVGQIAWPNQRWFFPLIRLRGPWPQSWDARTVHISNAFSEILIGIAGITFAMFTMLG